MAATRNQKLLSLELGRFVASILVTLYHIDKYYFNTKEYWSASLLDGVFRFGHSGVEFFFVLSGFIMIWAHQSYINNRARVGEFIFKRIIRIYPLVWLTVGISLALYLLTDTGPDRFRDPAYAIQSFLLFGQEPLGAINFPSWTLWHENLFYLFCILIFTNLRLGIAALAAWTLACMATIFVGPFGSDLFYALRPINALFALGVGCAFFLQRYRLPWARAILLIGGLGFIAQGLISNAHEEGVVLDSFWFGIASTMIIVGAVELERSGRLPVYRIFGILGMISFPLYLSHMITLPIMAQVLQMANAPAWMPPSVAAGLLLAGSVVAAIGLWGCFDRPVTGILQAWLQRRKVIRAEGAQAQSGNA